MSKLPPDHSLAAVRLGRRQVFRLMGSMGVAGGLAATAGCQPGHETTHSASNAQSAQRNLNAADFAFLSRLTEIIIPKTTTAGAVEAGVPQFIDAALLTHRRADLVAGSAESFWDNLTLLFSDGLRWLDERAKAVGGKDFMQLDASKQRELLTGLYAAAEAPTAVGRSVQFLRTLKDLTVEGYYTSQQGLIEELGYRGNAPHVMSRMDCKKS